MIGELLLLLYFGGKAVTAAAESVSTTHRRWKHSREQRPTADAESHLVPCERPDGFGTEVTPSSHFTR